MGQPKTRILFVDDEINPRFEADLSRSCEDAMQQLEGEQFDELWLHRDFVDRAHIISLVDWLIEQHEWEDPQVGCVVVFALDGDNDLELEQKLAPYFTVRHQIITPELFHLEDHHHQNLLERIAERVRSVVQGQ